MSLTKIALEKEKTLNSAGFTRNGLSFINPASGDRALLDEYGFIAYFNPARASNIFHFWFEVDFKAPTPGEWIVVHNDKRLIAQYRDGGFYVGDQLLEGVQQYTHLPPI